MTSYRSQGGICRKLCDWRLSRSWEFQRRKHTPQGLSTLRKSLQQRQGPTRTRYVYSAWCWRRSPGASLCASPVISLPGDRSSLREPLRAVRHAAHSAPSPAPLGCRVRGADLPVGAISEEAGAATHKEIRLSRLQHTGNYSRAHTLSELWPPAGVQ